MSFQSRRRFLQYAAMTSATAALTSEASAHSPETAHFTGVVSGSRKFTMDLRSGSIGVGGDQMQQISMASAHGFESVNADGEFLGQMAPEMRKEMPQRLKEMGLVWGAAGLTVEFRKDEAAFADGLSSFPAIAEALQQAGVSRVGTWLSPMHATMPYVANFRQHTRRLRECCRIMGDHGLRFGMEYVGPKTLWASSRHSFIHSMAETKELIAEIGLKNVGFVLDSWHWYTAHETIEDLLTLNNDDVVACDLNDAPVGREIDQQLDHQRELPGATGVIDVKAFLKALVDIGYDGPIRAEPFNAVLNEMEDEQAVAATATSMKQAFESVQ